MNWVVASEDIRHVRRDESYVSAAGPPIPGGLLHGKVPNASATLCRIDASTLHEWPSLSFPRTYGLHCDVCIAESRPLPVA